MFRHVDRRSTSKFIKGVAVIFARRVLGLEVHPAHSRKHYLRPYEHSYRRVSRFMHFQNLLREIEPVDGSIVECGVGSGFSLFDFAVISAALNRPRQIYGFDTFDGLPDPTSEDGKRNARMGGHMAYSREYIHEALLLAGLDEEFISTNITLVPGDIRQTLPSYAGGEGNPIAFLHIDVDLYESYRAILDNLYGCVASGGIIAFDEYADPDWPGATKAVDEFFADRPEQIVQSPVAERYYYTVKT